MKRSVAILAVVLLMFASSAIADTFQLKYDTIFSGTIPPSATTPWLLATFTDGVSGTVNLSVSAMNLTPGEYLDSLYFNNTLAAIPSFGYSFGGTAPTPTNTEFSGLNAYKADGDGYYDILFSFPTASGDRFTNGEVFSATLTGTGLTAATFNDLSVYVHGSGTSYLAAAHINGIIKPGGTTSVWVAGTPNTVPEPVATVLFITGGTVLMARRLTKKKKA